MSRHLHNPRLRLAWVPGALLLLGAVFFGLPPRETPTLGFLLASAEGAIEPDEPGENPDPVGAFLRGPRPLPAAQDSLLEALRVQIVEARNARATPDARRNAVDAADALLLALGVVEDWRPLFRAELLAPLGDTAEVNLALSAIPAGSGLDVRWGWHFAIDALEAARDLAGARLRAESEAQGARSGAEAAGLWRRAGELAQAAQDPDAARANLLRAVSAGGALHPEAQRAATVLVSIPAPAHALDQGSLGPGISDQANLPHVAGALLQGRAWSEAIRLLWPISDLSPELRVGLGEALIEAQRAAEALPLLAPITGSTQAETPVALYWTGEAQARLGRWAEATQAFHALADGWPEHPLAATGLFRLAERGVVNLNDPTVQRFLPTATRTAGGEILGVQLGAGLYLAGNYAEAAQAFAAMFEGADRPATLQQTAYWNALALERAGDPTGARARLEQVWGQDPISFYGLFAGERIDAPVLPPNLAAGPAAGAADPTELEAALLRLRIHQVVPTQGSFAYELERLKAHFFRNGAAVHDFAEALFEGGFPVQGIVLGRDIHRNQGGEWDLRLLRIVFPFPYRESIVRESRARGLDPFFVAGLIRQESMFHATIASSAGAVGLMQLLPSTAQEVARTLGVRYDRGSLTDPEMNVRLGTQYLASMLRRFDGRAEDALSAYNAGPSRIQQWRGRPEYRDRDVFIEFIPFRETRHYVKVVQQNQRIYTALYGCPGFEPCLGASYMAAVARSPYATGAPSSALAR